MVTRNDLIKQVAKSKEVQLSVFKTTAVIKKFFKLLTENLVIGETVQIKDFGSFYVAERPAKTGVNIYTKEKVVYPPYKMLVFKAFPYLKKVIKENV